MKLCGRLRKFNRFASAHRADSGCFVRDYDFDQVVQIQF